MVKKYVHKWNSSDPNLRAFIIGVFLFSVNNGILLSTFNNFLNDSFGLTASERGFLEFPRELPGFLLIVVTGILSAFAMRTWSVIVGLLSAVGVLGLAYLSPSIAMMTAWMMIWSLSEHLFMPVESTMGLHLAHDGKHGKRLGQISGSRNLAMIFGSLVVILWAHFFSTDNIYMWLYTLAAIFSIGGAIAFLRVHLDAEKSVKKRRFILRIEYRFFYILNILFGARKQIFLTFGPWVLVTVFGSSPEIMATLIMISSIAGVIFRQAFGVLTDKIGEKKMFLADAVILLFVCAGFALSKNIYLLYTLFIIDNLMFATRIARTTYLNKIAVEKSDIPATISVGITMDHVVSMTIPFFGGLLWAAYGYQAVFIAASSVAFASFLVALFVRVK